MSDTRNVNWVLNVSAQNTVTTDEAKLAVLMDIREELQAIHRLCACHNVAAGFIAMQKLEKRWRKKRRKVHARA